MWITRDHGDEQRQRAYRLFQDALRSGALIRPELCELCGLPPKRRSLDGHHHKGYDDEVALDVQWLCESCHAKAHSGPAGYDAGLGKLTVEQLSEQCRQQNLRRTSDQNSAVMRKVWETRRQDSEKMHEQVSANMRKGWETRRANNPDAGRIAGATLNASLTFEKRSAASRKGRSEAMRKAWITRRARAATSS